MKKSPTWVAFLTLAFFLFFPLVGLLAFWNDAHGKIQKRATEFIEASFIPFYQSLEAGTPNEDSTVAFRDTFQRTHYPSLGHNPTIRKIEPELSWAREEEDKGIQYARLKVTVVQAGETQDFRVTIRRETIAPRWRYTEVEPL